MVDRFLLAVAAPQVAVALRLGDGMLGFVLGAAFALAYAAAAVPLGRLADRGWSRALLIGGAGLWSAASLLTGLATTTVELIAVRMLLGLGQAAFVPAALALLLDSPAERRAGRLALFTAAAPVGRSLALLGGGLILAGLTALGLTAEWRWLFLVTTLPNVLLIVLLLVSPTERTARFIDPGKLADPNEPPSQPAKSALLIACFLLAAVAPIVAGQAIGSWVPSLVVRSLGWSPARAGVLTGTVMLIAAPAGQLAGGWLARHWAAMTRWPVVVVAGGLWAALPAMALTAHATGPALAMIGIAGVSVALGIASFSALFGWQALVPAHARGQGNGAFMATITLVGVGAGPLIAGLVSEHGGGGAHGLAAALMFTLGLAAVLATIAMGLSTGIGVIRRPTGLARI